MLRAHGSGIDALVTALGTRAELGLGHGCCRTPYALETRAELGFGNGCSGDCMLLEHERN